MAQKTEFQNIEMPRWGEPGKWVGVNDAGQGLGEEDGPQLPVSTTPRHLEIKTSRLLPLVGE